MTTKNLSPGGDHRGAIQQQPSPRGDQSSQKDLSPGGDHRGAIQQRVLQCTGLTQEEYAIHQWEQAFAFLNHHIGEEDEYVVRQYTLTKEFWAWWRMQWSFRDEVFLDVVRSNNMAVRKTIRKVWLRFHQPERIDALPPTHLVRQAMAEMEAQVQAQLKRKMEQV